MREFFKKHKIKLLIYGYFLVLFAGVGYSLRNTSEDVFSLEKKVIVVDAGHGGQDPGKVVDQGEAEKEINLKIAGYLSQYLKQGGAMVIMSRKTDEALAESKRGDLRERRRLADGDDVDAFVSIHQNFYPSENVKGAQVFYPKASAEGKALADSIQSRLREIADNANQRVIKENNSYYMLKNTEKASVIVECGFLSNPEENKLLNSEEYQKKIAWSVYIGIADYFASKDMA